MPEGQERAGVHEPPSQDVGGPDPLERRHHLGDRLPSCANATLWQWQCRHSCLMCIYGVHMANGTHRKASKWFHIGPWKPCPSSEGPGGLRDLCPAATWAGAAADLHHSAQHLLLAAHHTHTCVLFIIQIPTSTPAPIRPEAVSVVFKRSPEYSTVAGTQRRVQDSMALC